VADVRLATVSPRARGFDYRATIAHLAAPLDWGVRLDPRQLDLQSKIF
jgi:hypothetical protein